MEGNAPAKEQPCATRAMAADLPREQVEETAKEKLPQTPTLKGSSRRSNDASCAELPHKATFARIPSVTSMHSSKSVEHN